MLNASLTLATVPLRCTETAARLRAALEGHAYRLVRSFDLTSARRKGQWGVCPYHGEEDCSCCWSAWVLYDAEQRMVATLVIYGHDAVTRIQWVATQPPSPSAEVALHLVRSLARTLATIPLSRRSMMAIDPVCGMQVDEKTAAATYEYQGKTYYFCAPGCKTAFERNPEQFLSQGGDQEGGAHHGGHGHHHEHGGHGGHKHGHHHHGGCCCGH